MEDFACAVAVQNGDNVIAAHSCAVNTIDARQELNVGKIFLRLFLNVHCVAGAGSDCQLVSGFVLIGFSGFDGDRLCGRTLIQVGAAIRAAGIACPVLELDIAFAIMNPAFGFGDIALGRSAGGEQQSDQSKSEQIVFHV